MLLGNFQFQGFLMIWITIGQVPIVLTVGADGNCLAVFFSIFFSLACHTEWKYCLKGLFKQRQPTNPSYNLHQNRFRYLGSFSRRVGGDSMFTPNKCWSLSALLSFHKNTQTAIFLIIITVSKNLRFSTLKIFNLNFNYTIISLIPNLV